MVDSTSCILRHSCALGRALIFSDVSLETGESNSSEVDLMSADALASLLKMASTQLVVITSCESFALAVILLGVTNVVAARDMVSPKMMATWVENFYKVLVTQPLSKALDYAINASRAPMRYYGRYSKPSDMLFTVEREKAITVEP